MYHHVNKHDGRRQWKWWSFNYKSAKNPRLRRWINSVWVFSCLSIITYSLQNIKVIHQISWTHFNTGEERWTLKPAHKTSAVEQKERRETFSVTLRSWSFTASTGQIGFFNRIRIHRGPEHLNGFFWRSRAVTRAPTRSGLTVLHTDLFTGTAVTSEQSSPTHHERTCGIQENQQWAWSHKKTFCPLHYQSCEFTILLLMDFRGALWQRSRQGFHQKITPS